MKIFVLASYSSKVDYTTGQVYPEYKAWLEDVLVTIESYGHEVSCALRADDYKINASDPVAAFNLDMQSIRESNALLALVTDNPSVGVQTELGAGMALEKRIVIAHASEHVLAYFNAAMVKTGVARDLILPLTREKFDKAFS